MFGLNKLKCLCFVTIRTMRMQRGRRGAYTPSSTNIRSQLGILETIIEQQQLSFYF